MGSIVFITGILLFLISCTTEQAQLSRPAQEAESISRPKEISGQESWKYEWEKLVKEARKEGKITVLSGVGGEIRPLLTNGFRRKYGIELDYVTGRGGEITEKLFSERRVGLYLQDVGFFGATTTISILKPANIIDPLEPMFILPEVLDKKAWLGGDFYWLDKERLFLAFISSVNISHYVNAALVSPEEVQSYRALLNPKWKGKISMNDPTVTGSGNVWFQVVGEKIMGWDYIKELVKQEPVLVRDQRLQVDWLVRGKYPVSITAKTDIVQEFRMAGANLVGILPLEGSYTTQGGGTVSLIKNAPHPNAAKVFINWLLTKEGQTLFSKGYGSPSRRLDIPTEGLDPLRIPQPGVKYFSSDDEELVLQRLNDMQLARELFGHLLK